MNDELPPALKTRPQNRYEWDFPTAWLLGTKLLGSLQDIVISALFDVDPRDWMTPGAPIDLLGLADGDDVWIDFLADSGDSPRLVYQVAYLLQQSSLAVHAGDGRMLEPLPRGRMLVFGGDTSYPIATRRRLLERVRAPFIWARQDLIAAKHALFDDDVLVFGVAGNHDYYNDLTGFERQFHDRSGAARTSTADPLTDTLPLPGYKLAQRASYFATILPFGWQLWGLDCETRPLDGIQLAYFQAAAQHEAFDNKLIVATSRPTLANHGPTNHDTLLSAFDDLGLERAFEANGQLDRANVRLDLSGDVHLYERYWGTDTKPALSPDRVAQPAYIQRPFAPTDDCGGKPSANYASVVSGLGGAFHHPSQIRAEPDIAPRTSWPGGGESNMEIGQRLLRPRKLFQAGAVGVIGMIVAALTYATRERNLLDLPFDQHDERIPLISFGIVAAITGTLIALGALTVGAAVIGRKLQAQVEELAAPRNWWGRSTYALTSNRVSRWLLRWVGVNYRNAWGVAITFWAWAPVLALWSLGLYALWRCDYLAHATDDHYLSTYVTVIVLGLFLTVLGAVNLGLRNGALGWILGAILGAVTAALVIWTPYAWARLAVSSDWPWIFAFPLYWLLRHLFLGERFLKARVGIRRAVSVITYLVVIALYTVVPWCLLHDRIAHDDVSLLGMPIAVLASAFLTCLWLGWYFLLCLQWNAHGNEAGGAARVVCFAEFLRIRLTAERAEVYVIGVDGPSARKRGIWPPCSSGPTAEDPPIARLVDHFVISRD